MPTQAPWECTHVPCCSKLQCCSPGLPDAQRCVTARLGFLSSGRCFLSPGAPFLGWEHLKNSWYQLLLLLLVYRDGLYCCKWLGWQRALLTPQVLVKLWAGNGRWGASGLAVCHVGASTVPGYCLGESCEPFAAWEDACEGQTCLDRIHHHLCSTSAYTQREGREIRTTKVIGLKNPTYCKIWPECGLFPFLHCRIWLGFWFLIPLLRMHFAPILGINYIG